MAVYQDKITDEVEEIDNEAMREGHVIPKVLPSPDGSKTADKVLAEYFREAGETSLPLIGFNEKLERRMELQEVMDRIETEKRQIEQELKMYLGEAA